MTVAINLAQQCGLAYYLTPPGTLEMHGTDRQVEMFARACMALQREMCDVEIQRLRGERALLAEVLREADQVLQTLAPESTDEDEGLRKLLGSIKRLTLPWQADERDLLNTPSQT